MDDPFPSIESGRAVTHRWITEFCGDHPYTHALADDIYDLTEAGDRLANLLYEADWNEDEVNEAVSKWNDVRDK